VTVAQADIANLAPEVGQRLATLAEDLDRLGTGGASATALQMDWTGAYGAYTAAIEDAFAVDEALADAEDGQAAAAANAARGVLQFGRVGETIERQDAVVASALAAGRMLPEQYQAFTTALGGQRVLTDALVAGLAPADRTAYRQVLAGDAYRSLSSMQNSVLGAGAGRAAASVFSLDQWQGAVQSVTQGVDAVRAHVDGVTADQADASSAWAVTRAALTAILGLVAVLAALLVSVRIGRGLVIELVRLRNSALELANRRLPQAMRRLRAGEKIDIAADVPVVVPGDGEIGQVGEALNAVQHAALQAAAERAELLTGVSGVFVNLARRAQSLVHRQLSLLDTMERRAEEPEMLEDLFRLDHLAARMRRHAEGLIIMSGATPGRVWNRPVPLSDVIRSAIAEVEDYARVDMRRMPELCVVGTAVSDLTHLIAELVENATAFSPPNTTVLVHGEPVGAGFAVEIEDRGLGMRQERMAEANRRIAAAHQLELLDSDRLGLFVVSRLANRHNIEVTLRRSPYGGTTAVVLLPTATLTPAEAPSREVLRQAPSHPSFDLFAVTGEDDAAVRVGRRAGADRRAAVGSAPGSGAQRQALAVRAADRVAAPELVGAPEHEAAPEQHGAVHEHGDRADRGDARTGGLPRRNRQTSLAPGLRLAETRGADGGADGGEPQRRTEATEVVAGQMSPEQARAMMSAFQDGFVRGRNAGPGDSTLT
jgi:signal transduction histidine kinase